jgi:hypothetical protein
MWDFDVKSGFLGAEFFIWSIHLSSNRRIILGAGTRYTTVYIWPLVWVLVFNVRQVSILPRAFLCCVSQLTRKNVLSPRRDWRSEHSHNVHSPPNIRSWHNKAHLCIHVRPWSRRLIDTKHSFCAFQRGRDVSRKSSTPFFLCNKKVERRKRCPFLLHKNRLQLGHPLLHLRWWTMSDKEKISYSSATTILPPKVAHPREHQLLFFA